MQDKALDELFVCSPKKRKNAKIQVRRFKRGQDPQFTTYWRSGAMAKRVLQARQRPPKD